MMNRNRREQCECDFEIIMKNMNYCSKQEPLEERVDAEGTGAPNATETTDSSAPAPPKE